MNKKAYIKPELMVEELATESLMLVASMSLNEEGGEEQSLTNGRRGSWGNLWEK
ncbi:MAG: hypothetical protein IJC77_06035 [Bacteroidaceae bacterium]|nr:hypothetical protein [Bacteroidaceae bacterium]